MMTRTRHDNRDAILIVDDDPGILESHSLILGSEYDVLTAQGADAATDIVRERRNVYCVILDIRIPGKDGLQIAKEIREVNSTVPIIFYTGYPGDYDQRDILRQYSPFGFLIKGNDPTILHGEIRNAVTEQNLRYDPYRLIELARREYGMVCASPRMLEAIRDVECFSQSRRTVLIVGEPGTGKELIAGALHRRGLNPTGPFIPFNCDHTSPDILKATLFGTEPGIYTDAVKRDGLTQDAAGGTIFLDEIADLHPESQSVLMRFLESGEVQRMGSSKSEVIDVRIVTATNRPIKAMTQEGQFRQDLYDRIARVRIMLPSLRDRREDIPPLANYFIAIACREFGRAERALEDDALDLLVQYDWPSNVRELENVIHRLVARSNWPRITAEDVTTQLNAPYAPMVTETTYQNDLEDLIRTYHLQLLIRYKTIAEAARQKRCDPSNLRRKLKDLGIDPAQFDTDKSGSGESDGPDDSSEG